MASLYDVTEEALREMDAVGVLALDSRCHKVCANDLKDVANDHRLGKLMEVLTRVHGWVVAELARRGIAHRPRGDVLDRALAKVVTDMGTFTRRVPVADKWGVRVPEATARALGDGRASFLSMREEDAAALGEGPRTVVVLSGGAAVGLADLSLGGGAPARGGSVYPVLGGGRDGASVGVSFRPFVNAEAVKLPPGPPRGVYRPGEVEYSAPLLEKQARRQAVLVYVFDSRDRALLVRRRFPPLVWGPPGGFVEEDETLDEAARREVMEETGIETRFLRVARDLGDMGEPDLWGGVARAEGDPKPSRELREARWVAEEDIPDFTPLSPGKGSFTRALDDLRAFEAAAGLRKVLDIGTRDVSPALVASLPDEALRELADALRERARPFFERGVEPEDLANAMAFILDAARARNIAVVSDDPLDALASRLVRKDAGRAGDPSPATDAERVRSIHAQLPESLVVVPGFVSLSGSQVYPHSDGSPPNDADVVYRCPEGALGLGGLALKIERALKAILGDVPVQHISAPEGSAWTSCPAYDLVLVKRPEARIEHVREDFARFIKRELATDPRRIHPGVAFEVYKAAGEFYLGQGMEAILDGFAREALAEAPLYLDVKADGFRIVLHVRGRDVRMFTEGGRDRAFFASDVADWLRSLGEDAILDAEFVPLMDGNPVPRQEGIALIVANARPPGLAFRVLVHDAVWAGGKNLAARPFEERRAEVERLVPERPVRAGPDTVGRMPTARVENVEEFVEALPRMARLLTAEGVMAKRADFLYEFGKEVRGVWKVKNLVEYDAVVIGWRKVPRGRPPGEKWTAAEALRNHVRQAAESRTYVLRVAVEGKDGKLVPIGADHDLGPADLTLSWNEEAQRYEGTEDPRLWTACPGWPSRKRGEVAYGATFAARIDEGPKCGMVVTVAPGQFQRFTRGGAEHWAHMFPRVTAIKPEATKPGKLADILAAFARLRPAALAKELCGA